MTEPTDKVVLMKCTKCGYVESVPLKDLILLREIEPIDDTGDHILCPFCLHDMYPIDSPIFKK